MDVTIQLALTEHAGFFDVRDTFYAIPEGARNHPSWSAARTGARFAAFGSITDVHGADLKVAQDKVFFSSSGAFASVHVAELVVGAMVKEAVSLHVDCSALTNAGTASGSVGGVHTANTFVPLYEELKRHRYALDPDTQPTKEELDTARDCAVRFARALAIRRGIPLETILRKQNPLKRSSWWMLCSTFAGQITPCSIS